MSTDIRATAVARRGRELVGAVVDRGLRKSQRALGYAAAALPDGPIAGTCIIYDRMPLTPELLLMGYSQGLFPMDFSGTLRWQSPDPRSVLMLDDLHVGSRLRTYVRRGLFEIRFDSDPEGVLAGCADREETWLAPRLVDAFRGLAELGALHTVEAWRDGRLAGGAFGVAVGRVFSVESMFHRQDHASKIAFVHLARHLRHLGFDAIDCQYHQPHFARFGAADMPRDAYRRLVAHGLAAPAIFSPRVPTDTHAGAADGAAS